MLHRGYAKIYCFLLMLFMFCSRIEANVVSVDTQNFNPTYNGLDFVTVQSSETLEPGVLNLGLFLNYAVNTLPYYSEPGEGARSTRFGKVRDSISSSDLSVGIGLLSFWDIGLSLPFMLSQEVHTSDPRGEYANAGLTEVRVASKLRLLGNRSGGMGLVGTFNQNEIEDNPFVGKGGGPIFSLEWVGDTQIFDRMALGINFGYRWRNPGKKIDDYPIEPTQDQLIGSLAASYLVKALRSKVIWETFAAVPVNESKSSVSRAQSVAESLLGIKHDLSTGSSVHIGFGTELNHSYASPDWRVYLGTNIAMGPLWGSNDAPIVQKKVVKVSARKMANDLDTDSTSLNVVDASEEYPSDADETFVLKDIYFAFDSDYRALPGAKEMLKKISDRISARKFKKMIIEGHTDWIGSDEYNMTLGLRRANTIRAYLVQQFGLDKERIVTQSFGESRPVGDNGNYQGRQLNRRVVFRIYY